MTHVDLQIPRLNGGDRAMVSVYVKKSFNSAEWDYLKCFDLGPGIIKWIRKQVICILH